MMVVVYKYWCSRSLTPDPAPLPGGNQGATNRKVVGDQARSGSGAPWHQTNTVTPYGVTLYVTPPQNELFKLVNHLICGVHPGHVIRVKITDSDEYHGLHEYTATKSVNSAEKFGLYCISKLVPLFVGNIGFRSVDKKRILCRAPYYMSNPGSAGTYTSHRHKPELF